MLAVLIKSLEDWKRVIKKTQRDRGEDHEHEEEE